MSNDSKNILKPLVKTNNEPPTEALRARQQKELRLQREAERRASKTSFLEKLKTHRYWFFRALYIFVQSIWIAAIAIGGFVAWLISFLFI